MNQIKMICFLSALLLTMIGCSTPSMPLTAEEQRYLSTGPGPIPEDYQEIVMAHMDRVLIDPESARYSEWKGPKRGTVPDFFNRRVTGWMVCAEVNAKNRLGGYAGRKLYFFLIHGGKVVVENGGYRSGTVGEQNVCDICGF
jgi:hypothetical protein